MPSSFIIGPLTIHFYAIAIMLGIIAVSLLARRQAFRQGQDGDQVWDMLVWIIIAGIIGARLWHIFTPSPSLMAQGVTTEYYLTHPLDAIAIWNGGLGIPGAVAGGALALFIFVRKHHLSFLTWLNRRLGDRLMAGDLFLFYLIVYPLGRFLLEFLRLDSSQLGGVNANQTLMLVVMLAASFILGLRHRPGQHSPVHSAANL